MYRFYARGAAFRTPPLCKIFHHGVNASAQGGKDPAQDAAAFLAGLASGFWGGTDELVALRETDDVFRRTMDPAHVDALLAGWHDAVRRVM